MRTPMRRAGMTDSEVVMSVAVATILAKWVWVKCGRPNWWVVRALRWIGEGM